MEMAVGLVIGLVVGGAAIWFILRARIQAAREKAKADAIAERASVVERLQNRDRQIQDLKNSLQDSNTAIAQCQEELRAESAKYAGAEARASRIPELVTQLKVSEERIQQLQTNDIELRTKLLELEARLAEERRVAEEKLDLLNQLQQNLVDSFKEISADALRSNGQSFVELAQVTLERFKENVRADSTLIQQIIDESVNPLKISVEKVDDKLQEIETTRLSSYTSLSEQIQSLAATQAQLQRETTNLVKVLRALTTRR